MGSASSACGKQNDTSSEDRSATFLSVETQAPIKNESKSPQQESPLSMCYYSKPQVQIATTSWKSKSSWSSRKGSNKKRSRPHQDDESNPLQEPMDSEIGTLWEECFDLSEALGSLKREIAKNLMFWNNCLGEEEDFQETWMRFLDLYKNIFDSLAEVSVDEIVFGLQAIFATKDKPKDVNNGEWADNIPYLRFLEVSKEMGVIIRSLLNQSFELFLISGEIYRTFDEEWLEAKNIRKEVLIHESSKFWSNMCEIFTHMNDISRKLLLFSRSENSSPRSSESANPKSTANQKEILSILGLAHNIVKRKLLGSEDGHLELTEKVRELFLVLRKDF